VSTSPIRALLTGAIDYAGLFPPAELSMSEALRNYAAYLESSDAWALGRFVVPAAGIREMRKCAAAAGLPGHGRPPLRLSVIAALEWPALCRNGGAELSEIAVPEAVEVRAKSTEWIAKHRPLPSGVDTFFEIPIEPDPGPLIAAIKDAGGKAKVRTGGVTPDAFPGAEELARFIVTCARADVAFKATAGLHHPLRATFRLTYEPDSPTGEMFGFLNVLLAAAFARAGLDEDRITALLGEGDAGALDFGPTGIAWRGHRLATSDLARSHATFALSFGSCSFREPIDELRTLGLL
jgi:hypothetical protein